MHEREKNLEKKNYRNCVYREKQNLVIINITDQSSKTGKKRNFPKHMYC